jgi:hypothetical protein
MEAGYSCELRYPVVLTAKAFRLALAAQHRESRNVIIQFLSLEMQTGYHRNMHRRYSRGYTNNLNRNVKNIRP